MRTFASKLDGLAETLEAVASGDQMGLASAMGECAGASVLAVGSGGSAVTAEVLAACRAGLGHGATVVTTPMAYVLEAVTIPGSRPWFFSAGGDNHDILAAFRVAAAEAASIDVVTSGPDGALSRAARDAVGGAAPTRVHLVPVADPKDGFLATHSLVSAAASLVLASDILAGGAHLPVERLAGGAEWLGPARRAALRAALTGLSRRATLLVLHDPHLLPAAVLIETSLWEAGVCAVQRTDFRNFAHGRHVWLARYPEDMFIVALTCDRARSVWEALEAELPGTVPRVHLDFGRAGRGAMLGALLAALAVVEAAGDAKAIDPGRPQVPGFGRAVFAQSSLATLAIDEGLPARRKRRAERLVDPSGGVGGEWAERFRKSLAALAAAEVGALVLDYDGTVVPTPRRCDPPRSDIVDSLVGLADAGVDVAFATGRGGSVGEMLRRHLPERVHGRTLVGYYNGAHIVPLAVDIDASPPDDDDAVAGLHAALVAEPGLFVEGWVPKRGALQLTVPLDALADRDRGARRIASLVAAFPGVGRRPATRVLRSGHSLDIVPLWASKARVVRAMREGLVDPTATVLAIGDSGDGGGNDFDLLEGYFGLSVDRVCHRSDSCWNLLPPGVSGPDGLSLILGSLKLKRHGVAQLDVSNLFTG